jgi:hypothetical protein
MRTLLGMQYGGNLQQQYPRRQLQLQPQSFQEGGDVHISPAYAALFRKKKKQLALDEFGEAQAEQVEKQKKAGLFGSIASLAGGAGAAWLTPLLFSNPATAALALPWLVGGATGATKYFGEKAGYGEEQDVDMDMMYAKEAGLGDIERAGEEYQSGMFERAALSGLKSGLTAGFAPDASNMFGKIAGRENPGKYFNLFDSNYFEPDVDPSLFRTHVNEGGMIKQNPNTLLGYLAS